MAQWNSLRHEFSIPCFRCLGGKETRVYRLVIGKIQSSRNRAPNRMENAERHFGRNEEFARRISQRRTRSTHRTKQIRRILTAGEQVLCGLVEKWKTSTYDLDDLRGYEYTNPLERNDTQVALLRRKELQPSAYGDLLTMSLKAIGDPPLQEGVNLYNEAQMECPIKIPNYEVSWLKCQHSYYHSKKKGTISSPMTGPRTCSTKLH